MPFLSNSKTKLINTFDISETPRFLYCVCCFAPYSRIFRSYDDVTVADEWLSSPLKNHHP